MREIDTKKKRRLNQVKWIDSNSRFFATVSSTQNQLPLVCMEICVPSIDHTDILCDMTDDLFIPLQEVLILRPYQPRNAMLTINPSIHEVVVHVENFWCQGESGGNSGRPIRRGTVYVTGETEALQRLRGEKDTRFTKQCRGSLNGDASGVRGLEHTLRGGIHIRRLRTAEVSSTDEFSSVGTFPHRWICIDYSSNHPFHCSSIPVCVNRSGSQVASLNPACFNRGELFLQRRHDNTNDPNAIAIVVQVGGQLVGFVPREFSACLAPCMDGGVVTVQKQGVYSEVDVGGDPHHRVWFRVDAGIPGSGKLEEVVLQKSLRAIPWWVESD